jgi:hypothetical protein
VREQLYQNLGKKSNEKISQNFKLNFSRNLSSIDNFLNPCGTKVDARFT